MTDKNKLLYQYDKATATAINKIKKITGIATTTKAITKAVLEYPKLTSDLDKANKRMNQLEAQLGEIKELQTTRDQATQKLDKIISKL